jgi:hypothetical protein
MTSFHLSTDHLQIDVGPDTAGALAIAVAIIVGAIISRGFRRLR